MSVREVTPGNIRQDIFSNELKGVGGVPICKNCKHRIYGNRCNRHRDIITGEPYPCEVCRELKEEHICGTLGKFYEEKVRNKGVFSISFFVFTLLNAAIVFAVFSSPFVLAAALACFLLVELVILWICVVCAIEAETATNVNKGGQDVKEKN